MHLSKTLGTYLHDEADVGAQGLDSVKAGDEGNG